MLHCTPPLGGQCRRCPPIANRGATSSSHSCCIVCLQRDINMMFLLSAIRGPGGGGASGVSMKGTFQSKEACQTQKMFLKHNHSHPMLVLQYLLASFLPWYPPFLPFFNSTSIAFACNSAAQEQGGTEAAQMADCNSIQRPTLLNLPLPPVPS